MKIVPMEISHIEPIVEIEKLCFSTPWSKTSFLEELKNNNAFYLVAIKDDRVLGYGGFHHVLDEGEIVNIAVHPDFRQKGIGKKLLEGLLIEAVRLRILTMFLEVRVSNNSAKGLYQSLGFVPIAMRKNYYNNPLEDAQIMQKTF